MQIEALRERAAVAILKAAKEEDVSWCGNCLRDVIRATSEGLVEFACGCKIKFEEGGGVRILELCPYY